MAPTFDRATIAPLPPAGADTAVTIGLYASDSRLPVVAQARVPGVDLAAWCAEHAALIERLILDHGGVLFRGFAVGGVRDFERAATAACGELYGEYGDLPRNDDGERIYHSTPYPADQMILWHCESSHLARWPMRISFCCLVAPGAGGCTPIADTRALMDAIDPEIVDAFRRRGLTYLRTFTDGIEPSWQSFFRTEERSAVEAICERAGTAFEWRPEGGLRLRQRAAGVRRHPVTGDELFFNQVQLHHVACLDPETREGLRALFDEDDLPRNVVYGDGAPIPDDAIAHIVDVCDRGSVRFGWQTGDVVMLDNMQVAHARDTYEPPRQIAVAMARIVDAANVPG